MRMLYAALILCALVLLLGATGCAKKAKEVTAPNGMKYTSGTCAVCSKQSDKLIDFTVPHGPNVKVCSPECAGKIGADPEKYGGSVNGPAPK